MLTKDIDTNTQWRQCKTNVFWGEIAPADHLVQIYESDDIVLDSLEGFVDSGIKAGDAVIVIATPEHLIGLNERIISLGYDLQQLHSSHQYIPLNAKDTLAKFMKDGWPDEQLFTETVKEIITSARGQKNRRVRAYGEMVAILWAEGHNGATVHLESLWNKFCATEVFCLFCAYPKSGFTQDINSSIEHICSTHSMMIAGGEKPKTEVHYHRTRK